MRSLKCLTLFFATTALFLTDIAFGDDCFIGTIIRGMALNPDIATFKQLDASKEKTIASYNQDNFGFDFLGSINGGEAYNFIIERNEDECLEMNLFVASLTIEREINGTNEKGELTQQKLPVEPGGLADAIIGVEINKGVARAQGKAAKTRKTRDVVRKIFFNLKDNLTKDVIACGESVEVTIPIEIEHGFAVEGTKESERVVIRGSFTFTFKCKPECCEKTFARSFDDITDGEARAGLIKNCPEGSQPSMGEGIMTAEFQSCGTVPAAEIPQVSFFRTPEEAEQGFQQMKEALQRNFCQQNLCPSDEAQKNICSPLASGIPILDIDSNSFNQAISKRISSFSAFEKLPEGDEKAEVLEDLISLDAQLSAHRNLVQNPDTFQKLIDASKRQNGTDPSEGRRFMSIIEKFSCVCVPCTPISGISVPPSTDGAAQQPPPPPPQDQPPLPAPAPGSQGVCAPATGNRLAATFGGTAQDHLTVDLPLDFSQSLADGFGYSLSGKFTVGRKASFWSVFTFPAGSTQPNGSGHGSATEPSGIISGSSGPLGQTMLQFNADGSFNGTVKLNPDSNIAETLFMIRFDDNSLGAQTCFPCGGKCQPKTD